MDPDSADSDLGFVVPRELDRSAPSRVVRFVEKPTKDQAGELVANGAVWNTFIFVGRMNALFDLFGEEFAPAIAALRAALDRPHHDPLRAASLERIYRSLESLDFSRAVLERNAHRLNVFRVPKCGWTDLGTRKRVEEAIRLTAGTSHHLESDPDLHRRFLDLAYTAPHVYRRASRHGP
jgi:mannose-1-phosphate guanylyltransferase